MVNKNFIFLVLFGFISIKGFCQASKIFSDMNHLRLLCYLEIARDQANSIFIDRFDQLKNNNSYADSIQIIQIASEGFSDAFTFFKCRIQYPGYNKPFEYIFGYNMELKSFYKLKGFQNNDFVTFFDYLKTLGYKINNGYFEKKQIVIDELDLKCLIDVYSSKRYKPLTDPDKAKNKCLEYNTQPVTTN